ncbi:type II secretion system F family protein, partial [Cupriavidus sp. 2MCAB6]
SLERGSRRVNDAQLARLARDLAVLLQAGLPLDTVLRIASTTTEEPRMRALALQLMEGVQQGSMLAEIMEGMPGRFRPEYIRIVQAGDVGADLGGAMQELAELLDRRVEIRSRIRSAMA